MINKDIRWLNEDSLTFLKRGYISENENVSDRIKFIAETAFKKYRKDSKRVEEFENMLNKGWISLSSPIWSNYGTDKGLPISCTGCYVPDTVDGIIESIAEVCKMTQLGSGTSEYIGALRPRGSKISKGGKSDGAISFSKMFNTSMRVFQQGGTRRGASAVYMDIEHGDIEEFLAIQQEGSDIQDISNAVCVGRSWLKSMVDGDSSKRKLWAKVLECRKRRGVPYIFFKDNVNDARPQAYKDLGKEVKASNLCSEITLHSSEDESFICCLASMNALYFDEWKDTNAVEVLTEFLDTVIIEFKDKIKDIPYLKRVLNGAENGNDIGIGVLGWHSYLQSKMIPFDSFEAKTLNVGLFKTIRDKSLLESKRLAGLYGEPTYLKGKGERFVHRTAVAPTMSSSFILGQVSQGIEPYRANYYIRDVAKISKPFRNPQLESLLETKGFNTKEVWDKIREDKGSVQNLTELSQEERDVFKTFAEISQKEVVIQAIQRQKYICQSQSLNLFIHDNIPTKDVNELVLFASDNGIKTLYYQHGQNAVQTSKIDINSCKSCEA